VHQFRTKGFRENVSNDRIMDEILF
jgi:hypothetical protein